MHYLKRALFLEVFLFTTIFLTVFNFFLLKIKYPNNASQFFLVLIALLYSLGPLIFLYSIPHFLKRQTLARVFTLIILVIQAVNLILTVYFIDRHFSFDIQLLLYNADVALKTVYLIYPQLFVYLGILIIVLIFYYFSLVELVVFIDKKLGIGKKTEKRLRSVSALYALFFVFLLTKTEAYHMVYSALISNNEVKNTYYKYFNYQLDQLHRSEDNSVGAEHSGRNIIVLQLESLNSSLVDNKVTPNFLKITEDGVYLKNMQSNSVNSIRSLEGVLCGLVPSLSLDISRLNPDKDSLRCLPRILAENGYKTFFFMSEDVLRDTRQFVSHLGFSEVHFEDIMEPGDTKLRWGYKDDIFLQRVFEYLQKYKDEKIFVFIDLSTNHFPFYDLSREEIPEYNSVVPYPNPVTFKEKLENTTYIQDMFVAEFYEKYYKKDYAYNTDLIMFSDHSWPYGVHPKNYYNENLAYQENLSIPFAFIPAEQVSSQFAVGSVYDFIYAQYDIPSTLLALLEIPDPFQKTSFSSLLLKNTQVSQDTERCVISTQPYSGGYISLVKYPEKYIFSLKENMVSLYNLEKDPDEKIPSNKITSSQTMKILSGCLKKEVNYPY